MQPQLCGELLELSPWAVGVVGVMLANPASGGDRRAKVNRLIWRIFTKKHGITLKQEAVDFLITKLASSEDTDMEAIEGLIEYVGSMYVRQENRKDLVDLASLQSTVDGILKSAMNQIDFEAVSFRDYVHVVNAARVSKWEYEPHSKQFSLAKNKSGSVLCSADEKVRSFVSRYEFTKQRLLRHERFSGISEVAFSSFGLAPEPARRAALRLTSIKSVKGQDMKEVKCVFGMLNQMIEGQWVLEDPEDTLRLDFTGIESVASGRYTEGSFVLLEGFPGVNAFKVLNVAMPPAEAHRVTRSLQSYPEPTIEAVKEMEEQETLQKMLAHQQATYFLFFSDVWLDNAACLARFAAILQSHAEHPPAVIVMMGRFLEAVPPEGPRAFQAYETAFDRLAAVINGIRLLKSSTKFVLVPSQEEAFYPNVLPRPGFPPELFEAWREYKLDLELASNPCRIKCFTRDIVVMRQDMTAMLERLKVHQIPQGEESTLAQTLLDQGHACPIPMSAQQTQWNLDHALYLYPVPDLLCVAEKLAPHAAAYVDCQVVNPGDFYRSGLCYAAYFPAHNQVKLLQPADL